MKRILIVALVISAFMATAVGAAQYGWTLSGSAKDPFVSTGTPVPASPFQVHLWLACTSADGMSAAEFSIEHTFVDVGFTPLNGALNAGNSTDLLLAVGGCPFSYTLLGMWTFLDFTGLGGTACLVDSPGGVNGTVDCDTLSPIIHANAEHGFSTDGSAPCCLNFCGFVSVEDASWGSIKGLYR